MMDESEMAVFEYRLGRSEGFRSARKELREQTHDLEELRVKVSGHSEQISGDGGLQNGLRTVRREIASLRTALYALTGSIIVATVTLATAIATHAV